jgi:hypothetical protein
MKTFKTLAISALALSAAAIADAQTTIRIVASNGDRNATQTAISKILSGWTYQGINGHTAAGGNLSVATGSNFGAWKGTYAGQQVIVKTSYSGALAGIAAVAGKIPQRFVTTDGSGTGPVPNPLTSDDFESSTADFGFSTNFQSTSPFNGDFEGVTYSPVSEEIVGVSPLGFYASPGFPGSPSNPRPGYVPNITTALARQLYETGSVRLAQFTGDWVNDRNKIVYAINRNTDAGQRFGALLEIGFTTSSQVQAWYPNPANFLSPPQEKNGITYGATVGRHEPWPVSVQPGTFAVPLGSGGYSTGANLAAALTYILGPEAYKGRYLNEENQEEFLYPDAVAGYYVGYLTPGDANNRVLGANNDLPEEFRGVALRYNGVENTTENVRNGTYTVWLYNRILKPQTGLTGLQLQFANALRDQISTVDAPAGGGLFDDANMRVERSTDGGLVTPK